MSALTGYSANLFRAADATLASFGAGAIEIGKLSQGMADYLAMTRGVNATQEDAVALATKLGKAVDSGKLVRLGTELGLTKAQVKEYGNLHTAMERVDFLNRSLELRAAGQAAAQRGTDPGKFMAAVSALEGFRTRSGSIFAHIKDSWTIFAASIIPTFEPVVNGVLMQFQRISDGAMKVFTDPAVKTAVDQFRTTIENAAKKQGSNPFAELGDPAEWGRQLAHFFDQQKEATANMLMSWQQLSDWLKQPWDVKGAQLFASTLHNVQTIAGDLKTLFEAVEKFTFGGVIAAITAIGSALTGVVSATQSVIDALGKLGNMVVHPQIGTDFDKSWRDAHKGGTVGDKPGTTPGHAAGGIFSGAHHAIIGERGTEAVIPIRRNANSMNLLERTASAMGVGRGSGAPNITVNVTNNITGHDGAGTKVAASITDAVKRVMRDWIQDEGRVSFA